MSLVFTKHATLYAMIAILDYGAGNIHSVLHALHYLNVSATVTANPADLLTASHVIVPGQGAFKQAMEQLHRHDLVTPLQQVVAQGTPFLGICLGFQILFEASEEHGHTKGLGFFPGTVVPFKSDSLKIPHMGWNTLSQHHDTMFSSLPASSHMYFVHSFYVPHSTANWVAATTQYGESFVSAVCKENVWGTQFHPEKSSAAGLQLLQNFLSLT